MKLFLLTGALALLFQPFLKISLGRYLWNVMDVLVVVALIVSVYILYRRKTKGK